MLFSGLLSSRMVLLWMNSGQVLSQLACVFSLQEMQKLFSLLVHAAVRCASPQVPQVSLSAEQLLAKCPQRLHFMHCVGSCFCFVGLTCVLQILRPSLIRLLAVSTDEIVKIAYA